MNNINWDKLPDELTMEQFYKLCHVSKKTARYLLRSGKIPCKYTGKRTHSYTIRKEDVIAFLKDREKALKTIWRIRQKMGQNSTRKLRTVKASTVISYHAVIYQALKYAMKIDLVTQNVAMKVDRPKKNDFQPVSNQNQHLDCFFLSYELPVNHSNIQI